MSSPVDVRHGVAHHGALSIDYYEGGTGDGATIVLVHGTGGSARRHFGILQPLLGTTHRTLAYDWTDPLDGDLTVDQLVDQLEIVLDAAAVTGPIILVGYSLGAVVAAAAAARLAERISGLILVAGWVVTDNHQRFRNRIWRTMREEGSSALAEFQVLCALGAPYIQSKPWALVQAAIDNAPSGPFFDRQMDLNARVDISAALTHITAPALVIACRYDQMVPARQSKFLFGGLADARYVELESGHAVLQERPAELFELIENFLAPGGMPAAGSVLERPTV